MFKIVLVPIDISQTGMAAATLSIARELAGPEDGRLILLNVIEALPAYVMGQIPGGIPEEAASRAQSRLTQMVEDHQLPHSTEIMVRHGHVPTAILEVARETQADAIVMASHDPEFADYLLGSVAARVVRHAHCSVLVVRHVNR
ncbi:MAG: universal stress protein [Geminicoccaceae bacterium]